MLAEVIAIGDELTSGQRVDTNSRWLSDQLGRLGVRVAFHTTVGDDLETGAEAFRIAIARVDIVLSTGGLGPTADDLTREALAAALHRELDSNRDALEHIRGLFRRRGRDMPEGNQRQALIPRGCRMIANPYGTAPGIAAVVPAVSGRTSRVFALPGVPAEMREMFQATVLAEIRAGLPEARVIRHRELKCFGLGESHLEARLPNVIARGREPAVGITVHEGTITLRITASDTSIVDCDRQIASTERLIRDALGQIVFAEGDTDLPEVVAQMLIGQRRSLAVVEFGTEGWLSRWMARELGAAGLFCGGLVRPSETVLAWLAQAAAVALDGVDLSQRDDLVRLAEAVRRAMKADLAIAVGTMPDEDATGDTRIVHTALADPDGSRCVAARWATHPNVRIPIAGKQALDLVRRYLLGIAGE